MLVDEIMVLRVADLRQKLAGLQLQTSGVKRDLQNRLLVHFGYQDEEEDEDDQDSLVTVEPNVISNEVVQSGNTVITNKPWFTLKDVEDSVSKFCGSDSADITKWVEELEECAATVQWNRLQLFVYAKQLLVGAAKSFVRSLRDVRDWDTLKAALLEEFTVKLSSAEIHRILQKRQPKKGESLLEFLYALMEIARPIKLDDASLIEYFVAGISDTRANKAMLYQAQNLKQLKFQIEVYKKSRGGSEQSIKSWAQGDKRDNSDRQSTIGKTKKCFKCGDESHVKKDCPKKTFNCFKCDKPGHKAADCRVKVETKKENESNAHVVQENEVKPSSIFTSSGLELKDIGYAGFEFKGLVDTGADVCLLRRSVFLQLGNLTLSGREKCLTGLGESQVVTFGSFIIPVLIDNIEMKLEFHVIPDEDISFEAILGRTILEHVDMQITLNGTQFVQRAPNNDKCRKEHQNIPSSVADLLDELRDVCMLACANEEGGIEMELSHLSKIHASQVREMVDNYQPCRNVDTSVKMKIILSDDIPVYQHPRRLAICEQEIVDNQIEEWLGEGIIKPSYSEYASPIVLVSKKNGKKRLCCDYRKLNEKIVRDNFPMAQMETVLEKLQGVKVFTTLDLTNGFFHVPVEPASQKYTSFVTQKGQFEFLYVPFGISNSPAVFTRYIMSVLRELIQNNDVVVYMDDVIVPSIDMEEGIVKLDRVLKVAAKNGLKINWNKCQFLQRKVNFLGYIIEDNTIKPSDEKTKAVANFPVPSDRKAIQRFLGLTSYFRKFIEGYAIIAKPLSDMLRKDSCFEFKEIHQIAFEQLKVALTSKPVLQLYNPNLQTELHTDASKWGYGAVLLQKNSEDSMFHPVQYMSRKTKPCEEKYPSYDLEVLAIIEALTKWRVYLLGIKFKIVTDCNAFTMTMKKKEVPLRVARWAMYLQDFMYEIEHRSGTKMRHVDALSRVTCYMLSESIIHRLKEAQSSDDWVRAVRKIVEEKPYEDFYLENGILFKDPNQELIVVPAQMENEVILIAHNQGHFSVKRTQDLVEKSYYIPRLKDKVSRIVDSCVKCIIVNEKSGRKEGYMQPIDKGDRPLLTYHIDHVGPMEITKKLYNYIFVVVDAFSKYVWLYATRSTGVEEVVKCLEVQSSNFGNPLRIVSDRGAAFTSNLFREYCDKRNIHHLMIATGVPRGNGQVERMHKIVIPMLSKLTQGNDGSWYKHLSKVQQMINNVEPRSTRVSPFKILTGLDMRIPDSPDLKELIQESLIKELDEERENIREQARENIKKIQMENKSAFDSNRKAHRQYQINDMVAIKRTQYGTGLKLKGKFLGPYKVVKIQNYGRYEVEKIGQSEGPCKTITVSEFMKPWSDPSGTNGPSGQPNVGIENERKTRSGNRY